MRMGAPRRSHVVARIRRPFASRDMRDGGDGATTARERIARVASHVDPTSRDARVRAMRLDVDASARGASLVDASEWIVVDQARIDAFASCTLDEQFIHARDAPGGAIAHGFLALALLTRAAAAATTKPWAGRAINYGLNRVRFVSPIRAGGEIRARKIDVVTSAALPRDEGTQTEFRVELETRDARAGTPRLALVADWIVRHYVDAEAITINPTPAHLVPP